MNTDEKPYQIKAYSDHIEITWQHLQATFDKYVIRCREFQGKDKTYRLMETLDNEISLRNLKSNTTYEIGLYIQREGEDELIYRETADTSRSIASQFMTMSEKIQDEPSIFKLRPFRVDTVVEDTKLYHMISEIDEIGQENMKTILVVGATGAGKSTLLDALVNFVLNVPYGDDFRFKLIDDTIDQRATAKHQVTSRTQYTTCYRIPQKPGFQIEFDLQIIDTPGFQDRNASQNNKEISKQLKALFASGIITNINAVCLVLPSSCRLTQDQQDIFGAILSLFGNDINCLIPLVTFDDGGFLNALNTLSGAGIPFMHHMHFRFNNASIFSGNESENAWNNRNESFKNLLASVSVNPKQSLKLTEEVLTLRTGILSDLKLVKHDKRELDKMCKQILQYKNEILYNERIRIENKDYLYTQDEVVETRRELSSGLYINCPNCKSKCRTIREASNSSCFSCMKSFWWGIIQMCSFLWGINILQNMCRCFCFICLLCCYPKRNVLECNMCTERNCMLGDHVKESALYRKIYQKVNKIHKEKKEQYDSASKSKECLHGKVELLSKELKTRFTQFEGRTNKTKESITYLNSIALKSEQYFELKELEDSLKKIKKSTTGT